MSDEWETKIMDKAGKDGMIRYLSDSHMEPSRQNECVAVPAVMQRVVLVFEMLAQQKHIIWICQFCGQCGDLGFDQRAGLEHLTRFLDRRLGDEGAAIWLKAHQAIVSQRLEGRANDSTADRIN